MENVPPTNKGGTNEWIKEIAKGDGRETKDDHEEVQHMVIFNRGFLFRQLPVAHQLLKHAPVAT